MAFVHGRTTVLTIAASDLSSFTKTSDLDGSADTHDLTHYGVDDTEHGGGLRSHSFSCEGSFDDAAASNPTAIIGANLGASVPIIRQVAGPGSGLPQESFDAIVNTYNVSDPVDDYVTWSAEFTVTGAVDRTAQV